LRKCQLLLLLLCYLLLRHLLLRVVDCRGLHLRINGCVSTATASSSLLLCQLRHQLHQLHLVVHAIQHPSPIPSTNTSTRSTESSCCRCHRMLHSHLHLDLDLQLELLLLMLLLGVHLLLLQ
jgi:hypothetical protein